MQLKLSKIDWDNINYPPFLKLFHFSFIDTEGKTERIYLRPLWITHILIFSITIINLINNII